MPCKTRKYSPAGFMLCCTGGVGHELKYSLWAVISMNGSDLIGVLGACCIFVFSLCCCWWCSAVVSQEVRTWVCKHAYFRKQLCYERGKPASGEEKLKYCFCAFESPPLYLTLLTEDADLVQQRCGCVSSSRVQCCSLSAWRAAQTLLCCVAGWLSSPRPGSFHPCEHTPEQQAVWHHGLLPMGLLALPLVLNPSRIERI